MYDFETYIPQEPTYQLGFEENSKTVRTSTKDFDILGKITKIKKLDDTFVIAWFKDFSGTLFEIRIDIRKFSVIS